MARLIKGNRGAFLDMIGHTEGTVLIPGSDDGYNVICGSTPQHPILFSDYSKHPRIEEQINSHLKSDAAGRYQLMGRFYLPYIKLLNLPDFSPASQDAIALQQIKECRALPDVDAGNIIQAVSKCAHIWASFPNAGYAQHEYKLTSLLALYKEAGGILIN
ncbi:MAG: glycoside hydrolase family 104 protein [Smithella sp.]|jgi:muramidase (phage lysozyme)